jgi:hypothetical protein
MRLVRVTEGEKGKRREKGKERAGHIYASDVFTRWEHHHVHKKIHDDMNEWPKFGGNVDYVLQLELGRSVHARVAPEAPAVKAEKLGFRVSMPTTI